MRQVPWWTLVSGAAPPVLLIGGSTLAADLQPVRYSAVTSTISALAAQGATDRWLMTGVFVCIGGCYLVTALGLRPAAAAGRLVLAAGGLATLLVAAFPQPAVGSSDRHLAAATCAILAMAVWPPFARRRGSFVPWGLRPGVTVTAAAVMLCAALWLLWEARAGGEIGLAERVAAGIQALWPLLVTVTARFGPKRVWSLREDVPGAPQVVRDSGMLGPKDR